MGDLHAWVNTVCAPLALVIAIAALFLGQIRSNRMQARLVELEEGRERERVAGRKRADLRVALEPFKSAYKLVVSNVGMAEAHNVRLFLDQKPQQEHCSAVHRSELPPLIGPQAAVSCHAVFLDGCHPPFEACIHWDDESGTDHQYRTSITW